MKAQPGSFARRVGSLFTVLFLAVLGSAAAWGQTASPGLAVPGYGPGVAGNVSVGPTSPVCQVDVPCTRPFAGATVLVVDSTDPTLVVGTAVTNAIGNFVVSVPAGEYLVHVQTIGFFPRCEDAKATVGARLFTLVQIDCDTGIR